MKRLGQFWGEMMKHAFLLFLLIVFTPALSLSAGNHHWKGITTPVPLSTAENGYTDWQWLNPLPHGNTTTGLWIFDENTWIIAGGVGSVIKTTNAGKTWALQFHAAGQSQLGDMAFVDDTTGFVVGEELIQSSDGGSTWFVKKTNHNGWLGEVAFANHDSGFVCGQHGTVLKTIDAGTTWSDTSIGSDLDIGCMDALAPAYAYGAGINSSNGKSIFVKTSDAGEHWSVADVCDTIDFTVKGISFPDLMHGWIVGYYFAAWPSVGYIFHTTDGGESWLPQNYPLADPFYQFFNVDFSDSLNGVVVGASGVKLMTHDGGVTWTENRDIATYYSLYNVRMLNAAMGLATGESGTVTVTTDSGKTWTHVNNGQKFTFTKFSFGDSSNGYAIGCAGSRGCGIVVKTTDGGASWNEINALWGARGIWFTDANHGIVVAFSDAFITTDGGGSWNTYSNVGAGNRLNDCMMRGDSAWAVGEGGIIAYTSDAGTTWSRPVSGVGVTLSSVFFPDELHGTIVGDAGTILHSTDGGATWSPQTSGRGDNLRDVYFVDADYGWAVSGGSSRPIILRTTNGGSDWLDRSSSPKDGEFNAVYFFDRDNGFAAGQSGFINSTIDRTTDGGETWTFWNNPCTSEIYDVHGVRSGPGYVAYVAGGGGAVLVAAVSPQNTRYWNWTGAVSSSWFDPENWDRNDVPLPGDSVLIPPSNHDPVMDSTISQVTVGTLIVEGGAKLTIPDSVSRVVVLADVIIDGTLEIQSSAATQILVGGNWYGLGVIEKNARTSPGTSSARSLSDQGFLSGKSRVLLAGEGVAAGSFYNLTIDTFSNVRSTGHIIVQNQFVIRNDMNLRPTDTLVIRDSIPEMLQGFGKIPAGTMQRAIRSGSTDAYRFESPKTTVSFYSEGTTPQTMLISTTPDSSPSSLGNEWQPAYSTFDPATNTVIIDSVGGFGTYAFGLEGDTVPTVRRFYYVKNSGGSDFMARLSLRIDPAEFPTQVHGTAGIQGEARKSAPHVPVVFVSSYPPVLYKTTTPQVYNQGWNLVSLPLDQPNTFGYYFRNVGSAHVFKFSDQTGYISSDSMYPGSGYWLKLTRDTTMSFYGPVMYDLGLQLVKGWNLIGTVGNKNVSAGSLMIQAPDTSHIVSKAFDYHHGYQPSEILESGLGYWIKLSGNGVLHIKGGTGVASKSTGMDVVPALNSLEIKDASGNSQTLYFGTNNGLNAAEYELPPLPPAGIFDARFGSGRMVELYPSVVENVQRFSVQIHSAQYPLTIRCFLQGGVGNGSIMLSTDHPGESGILLHGTGSVTIADPSIEILYLTVGSGKGQLPEEYALRQNYPNPFNPTTMIGYDLPEDSRVIIRVYDVLGRIAATLVDGKEIRAGSWTVQFQGENLSSGVYLYRMEAQGLSCPERRFSKIMKLLLVK